jgi:hypothetical protein
VEEKWRRRRKERGRRAPPDFKFEKNLWCTCIWCSTEVFFEFFIFEGKNVNFSVTF